MKSYRTCYLIRITTDTGIDGWGECSDWLPTLHKGFCERMIPYMIGKPVVNRSQLVLSLNKWHPRAAAAVSMALTEILAKSGGLSVCDFWGGKYREQVPVYASFQSYSEDSEWQKRSLEAIEQAVTEGFNKIKMKIGGKSITEDQEHVLSIQALLQGNVDLALDANQSYDVAAALEWHSLLGKWSNLLWMEEPLQMKHVAGYVMLRNRLPVPLAGGENIEKASDYIPLLSEHALDLITPDPVHVIGIDGYRETLRLARNFGIRATPHSFDGALTRLYALFAQACLEPWSKMGQDSIEPVEWDVMENPFTQLISVQPSNGEIALPCGVGIGTEINLDLLHFYQWDGSSYE